MKNSSSGRWSYVASYEEEEEEAVASSATCSLLRFSCDSCQALAMVRFMSSSPSWYICFIRLIRLELGSSSLPVLGVLGLRLRGEGEGWKEVGKYLYILTIQCHRPISN